MIIYISNVTQRLQPIYKDIANTLHIECLNYYNWLHDTEETNNEELFIDYTSNNELCTYNIEQAKGTLIINANTKELILFYKHLVTKHLNNVLALEKLFNMEGLQCA